MAQSYNIRVNSEVETVKWEELTLKSTYSTPFQIPTYYSFLSSDQNIKKYVFAVENNQQSYEALCVVNIQKERGLKSFFSKRGIIFGGPLIASTHPEKALNALLKAIMSVLKNKVIYIETRNFHNYHEHSSVFKNLGWNYIPYLNVKLNLKIGDFDKILSTFKYNRRREIKLTLKAGINYAEAKNEDEIGKIYDILRLLYNKKIGLPIPMLQYFIDFWKSGLMKIFAVWDNNLIIGGSFCVVLHRKAIYTYYYCSDRDYKPKTYPTHLAVLAAIDYGVKNKLKYLDFMGAGQAETEYGVRKYKMEFGGKLVEEGRYILVTKKLLYALGKKIIAIIKKKKN